jgi:hypothetical protein
MTRASPAPVHVPVEVVCTAGALPFVAQGRVREVDAGLYTVDLDQDAGAAPMGGRAILSFPGGSAPRVIARVEGASGNTLTLRQQGVRDRERRDFPRLHGGIPVAWRRLAVTERAAERAAWLAGDPAVRERGAWVEPDRFMNFSVSGLRFELSGEVAQGDLLLIDLGVPGASGRWRCTAVVRRVFPDDEKPSVAVEFEDIPEAASEALSDLTLDLQEEMLG